MKIVASALPRFLSSHLSIAQAKTAGDAVPIAKPNPPVAINSVVAELIKLKDIIERIRSIIDHIKTDVLPYLSEALPAINLDTIDRSVKLVKKIPLLERP